MQWYTIRGGFEDIDINRIILNGHLASARQEVANAINCQEIEETKRKEQRGQGFLDHVAYLIFSKGSYRKLAPLVRVEISNIRKQKLTELRKRFGVENIEYRAETILDSPHIDVYAASPKDAKRQLIEKREGILKFYGVNVFGCIDNFVVEGCSCPFSHETPAGYKLLQKNCA